VTVPAFALATALAFVGAACDSGRSSRSCGRAPTEIPGVLEAECMETATGDVRLASHIGASGGRSMHFGSNAEAETEGVGDSATWRFEIPRDLALGVLEVTYSDEVAGNVADVFWDSAKRGRIYTEATGGWNAFARNPIEIVLGPLAAGTHQLRIAVVTGGSFGLELDRFRLVEAAPDDQLARAYAHVASLVDPATGLVASAIYDRELTTVYKNALAAMAFIHGGDVARAEGIFDFFAARFEAAGFAGFNKSWNPRTGEPGAAERREGDDAFLLLALEHYAATTGDGARYRALAEGLVTWLASRASAPEIVAEGVANMHAALGPFEQTMAGVPDARAALRAAFAARADMATVADHIVRGALVFGDTSGLAGADAFARTEIADATGGEVRALAAFAGDDFINVEVSAEVALAAHLTGGERADLDAALDSLWIAAGVQGDADALTEGLPYTVTTHGSPHSADAPIVDTTCYRLFLAWSFNPWAPAN